MDTQTIVGELNSEIDRLTAARDLLIGSQTRSNGVTPRKKRFLSAAARRKISLAQKKRWAETRKAA